MKPLKAKDVDEYILNSPAEAHPVLNEVRKTIKSAVTKAEESISWNVPFYKYHGALAGFAVYKSHVSFGIAEGAIEASDRKALEKNGYKTALKTIQIKFNQKVPVAIIKKILKEKAKINEAKKATK